MKTATVKAASLIMDWDIWPRCEANNLDVTNLAGMKESLLAGEILPPILIDQKSKRIIDGSHRWKATMDVFGLDASIKVNMKSYTNERDMVLDAARYNSRQGLKLSPKDKAHVILKLRKLKAPIPIIAEALGMRPESVRNLQKNRTATTSTGEKIALANGAKMLAGKKLTKKEEAFARSANGMLPIVNARLFLNALRAVRNWPATYNEADVCNQLLTELLGHKEQIDDILAKRKEAA